MVWLQYSDKLNMILITLYGLELTLFAEESLVKSSLTGRGEKLVKESRTSVGNSTPLRYACWIHHPIIVLTAILQMSAMWDALMCI